MKSIVSVPGVLIVSPVCKTTSIVGSLTFVSSVHHCLSILLVLTPFLSFNFFLYFHLILLFLMLVLIGWASSSQTIYVGVTLSVKFGLLLGGDLVSVSMWMYLLCSCLL